MSDGPDGDADARDDPFDELDDAACGRTDDPFDELRREGIDAVDPPSGDRPAGPPADGPSTGADDPFDSPDSIFENVDVGDVDADAVWQELDEAESRGSVSQASDEIYAEVSKHGFCKGCEHLSAPPEVHCTHEGTEILEFVDRETVRVVDCPVVAERRRLEEET